MRTRVVIRSLLFAVLLLALSAAAFAQIGISVSFGPPALPVYEQPLSPGDDYIWTPGYWGWDGDDYYWVPGTWVEAPEVGYLWTPGYWGWGGDSYTFHEGYWGPHVGYYGGINYGYGYGGHGYEGGRWENDHFYYNTSVNRINNESTRNTYNARVEYSSGNRVSYNGGNGGINERPSAQEQNYDRERHSGLVEAQYQHVQQARSNPELRASVNQGRPPIAATSRPGDFRGSAVPAREAGAPYRAPERTAPSNQTRSSMTHANEVQSHRFTPPAPGQTETDRSYQREQDQVTYRQNEEHQNLQQQQEQEHQQASRNNHTETQRQQMEQRHSQQTQQLEQKHTEERQQVQAHQPRQTEPPAQSHPPTQRP